MVTSQTGGNLKMRRSSGLIAPTAVALFVMSTAAVGAQQIPQPPPAAPAPLPPPIASPSQALAAWQKALAIQLLRFRSYPPEARGVSGVVTVSVTIDRRGRVVTSRIVKSSTSAVLDGAALDPIKRASPLPVPPAGANLTFTIPISYIGDKS